MSFINYHNEKTGETFNLNFSGNSEEEVELSGNGTYYVDYYSDNLLDWTSSKTFTEIIEAYESGKNVVARSTVEARNFEGVEIEAQTRLIRLHKITPQSVEFTDIDFKDGTMEAIKVTHSIDNMITVTSLDVD